MRTTAFYFIAASFFCTTMVFAAEEMASAPKVKNPPEQVSVQLKTKEGKIIPAQVPSQYLKDLKKGEVVELNCCGGL
ncbi:hypothetical protein [Legionella nagasakiensis]|uniref:hypothetical protein n=1 Tax=Legionella nagasakiensis TaxID=535290 RepID=UPI00105419D9|nr:hypothetical protein [Legionella nagasakiensis]